MRVYPGVIKRLRDKEKGEGEKSEKDDWFIRSVSGKGRGNSPGKENNEPRGKESMKVIIKAGLALLAAGTMSMTASAQKSRTIVFNEDRAQHYMTTKVYELKNAKAHDILPFIKGAVTRFDAESKVESLDYEKGKQQYIVVSTGNQLIPYIDDMVAKLDFPSKSGDKSGSIVDGDGIHRYVYFSKYRGTENMREVIAQTFTGGYGSGSSYFDLATNTFYWKTSKSQGDDYLKFLKAIDRPVPQMSVALNVYIVNENDFMELGIDYLSWKNGPGANLFGTGFDWSSFNSVQSFDKMLDIVAEGPLASATGLGGLVFAPQIDATFLRMLAQKGKAKVATSASLTLVNDFGADAAATSWDDAKYRFKFTPQYQNIQKDDEQNMSIDVLDNSELWFYVSLPIICFSGYEADKAATLMCQWVLNINDLVEETNMGVSTVNGNTFDSTLTIAADAEKLIATYDKDIFTKQYSGIPFMGDIPVLKYLFGAETTVKTKAKVFVTMKASPVLPTADMPNSAGQVIEAAKLASK